jgi:hypothetical protein
MTVSASIKACFKCGATRPLTEFYRHPQMADGHLNKCVECTRTDVRENRKARVNYYREYDRQRGYRPPAPEVIRARNATRVLSRNPCSICGAERAEAHHPDYSKPLDVIWLCKTHHAQAHRKF